MNEYQLKNNLMLKDGCFLNSWYYQLQKLSGDFSNPLNNHLPKAMFKREEDKKRLDQIKEKTDEIIAIYKELRIELLKSLNNEDKKRLFPWF